jgi:hypothetical protein
MSMGIHGKARLALIALYMAVSCLWATDLSVSEIELQATYPVIETFTVLQNEEALDLNLVDSRNSSVLVGTYTLLANDGTSRFKMHVSPGEDGEDSVFAFRLDLADEATANGKTVLPFVVQVISDNSGAVSISGNTAMEKELGLRGILGGNEQILYENGDIVAEIPDFDPDEYSSGWYSAAIRLSIEVI